MQGGRSIYLQARLRASYGQATEWQAGDVSGPSAALETLPAPKQGTNKQPGQGRAAALGCFQGIDSNRCPFT